MNLFRTLLLILWALLLLSWIATGCTNSDLFTAIVAVSILFLLNLVFTAIKIIRYILRRGS
jgi:hypothetical protein